MTAHGAGLGKADIQRPIVYGYRLNRSRPFLLHVQVADAARTLVARLVDGGHVTDASVTNSGVEDLNKERRGPVNIGFTYRGLEKLELPRPYLYMFQEKAGAFVEGAYRRAARRLGDTGPSAAESWEKLFRRDYAHMLLSLHADEEKCLAAVTEKLQALPGASGFKGWKEPLDARHLTEDKDARTAHFGFRDGISQPAIREFHAQRKGPDGAPVPEKLHEPGEFLLGYGNDEKFDRWLMPNPCLLPSAPSDLAAYFKNGSFAALRKMGQNEKAFRDFVAKSATRLNEYPEYIRAKLGGRWDDGKVIKADTALTPLGRDLRIDETNINDFTFADDPAGEGCPFGAHIRRMNPRADQVVPFRRRPLIRRGMPYGPPYDEDPDQERGMLGWFFCASLEDQFEHLLAEWGNSNPMGPDNRGNAKDPLVGNHEDPRSIFDIPMHGETRCRLDGFTPFVTTRGTLYAFYPGLAATRKIARVDAPARAEA
jgi:deferrochelatase/peroxidase EfeB